MLEGWDQFQALRTHLLNAAGFGIVDGVAHRLRFRNARPLDLIPFGSIEGKPGELAWPPDFATVMSTIGFREASARSSAAAIDDGIEIPFASPAGLALLKLFSWNERDAATRRKGARDTAVLVPNYLKAGNEQRL
ncbi:MAG TPA: hypothetical protein VE046_02135 [Steroidobacteraceae bacterium]|nr:hypothetical protein [Steroidobacteraceae bacterium]